MENKDNYKHWSRTENKHQSRCDHKHNHEHKHKHEHKNKDERRLRKKDDHDKKARAMVGASDVDSSSAYSTSGSNGSKDEVD
jgi:hypothetical protein